MTTVIMAIGVIVILGIVAFFALKKMPAKGKFIETNTISNLPQNDTQALEQSPVSNLSANDDLSTAEQLIRTQNYADAIAELKRILMTNPRHNGAMLKLLQTYGVTKQYNAFHQLHQKIHEIADGETIREADFCKSLLDESGAKGQATSQPAASPSTQSQQVSTPATAASVAATTVAAPAASNIAADLDNLEDLLKPSQNTTVENTSAPSIDNAFAELDNLGNFGNIETPVANTADAQTSNTVASSGTAFDDLNFDFSNSNDATSQTTEVTPETTTAPVADDDGSVSIFETEPLIENEDLSFDNFNFDVGGDATSSTAADATTAQSVDDHSHDYDLDAFNLEDLDSSQSTESASTSTTATETTLDSFNDTAGGLDFDFSNSSQTPATNTTTLDAFAASDTALDLNQKSNIESLDSDIGLSFSEKPEVTASTNNPATDSFDTSFDFDISSSNTQIAEEVKPVSNVSASSPVAPEASQAEESFDFDFNFDSISTNVSQDESTDSTSVQETNLTQDTVSITTQKTEPVSTDVDAFDFNFDTDFGTTDTANTAQNNEIVSEAFTAQSSQSEKADNEFDLSDLSDDTSDGFDFSAEDLSFDTGSTTEVSNTVATEAAQTQIDDSLSFVQPTVAETTPSVAKADPVVQPDITSEFSFDEPAKKQEVTTETVIAPAATVVADTAASATIVASTTSVTPAAGGSDEIGVTLSLAKQYLNLGEFDSATRLLNEVLQTGNDGQKQSARELLMQLG